MAEVESLIRDVHLGPSGRRPGYDRREVDTLLRSIGVAASAGRPVRDLAEGVRFTTRRGADGYAMADVDALLEAVVRASGEVESDEQRALRWIEDVRFTHTGLGRVGYPMRDVDSFLDELAELVRGGRPVAEAVRGARFTPARRLEGYDRDEVEAFLVGLVEFREGVRVDRSRPDR